MGGQRGGEGDHTQTFLWQLHLLIECKSFNVNINHKHQSPTYLLIIAHRSRRCWSTSKYITAQTHFHREPRDAPQATCFHFNVWDTTEDLSREPPRPCLRRAPGPQGPTPPLPHPLPLLSPHPPPCQRRDLALNTHVLSSPLSLTSPPNLIPLVILFLSYLLYVVILASSRFVFWLSLWQVLLTF